MKYLCFFDLQSFFFVYFHPQTSPHFQLKKEVLSSHDMRFTLVFIVFTPMNKNSFAFSFTVNSLYSGHCRDLESVSPLATVKIESLYFSQASVIYFCPGFNRSPYYLGVRYSEVSSRWELTVNVSKESSKIRWSRVKKTLKSL